MKLLGQAIKNLWGQPLSRGLDCDSPQTILKHREIIESNPLLKAHYLRWYRECLPAYEQTSSLGGEVLEIGSGAGFLERVIPDVVKTEAVPNPFSHRVMDAANMDCRDDSLRAIFVISVLHHLPEPAKFLAEAQRCLKPGGRLVLVEPHNSFPQRFLCRWLDHYEYFDDSVTEWLNQDNGRLSRANMALPWVIFMRDRRAFERRFPRLKVLGVRHHTFLSYIISGGMSYRPFVPAAALPLINALEILARPFASRLATMMTIDIVKAAA